MSKVLYAGGATPSTGGDIDVSGLLKTDLSNITAAGSSVIATIAADSVSLDNLAKVDLSNITEGLFLGNLSNDRYVRFSNGLILQWGAGQLESATNTALITLYQPYKNYYRAFAISNSQSASSGGVYATAVSGMESFRVAKVSNGGTYSWFTIGF